jgi:hypothetical protein
MKKVTKIAILILAIASLFLVLSRFPFWKKQNPGVPVGNYFPAVLAEDDDEEDDEDEDEDDSESETKTETVYVKLSDTVTQKVETTTRHDSDGDGIYDDEDKYPKINDNFIVKDENLNGIDDKYEL